MSTNIYAVCHPITHELRYVGKTFDTVKGRLSAHINSKGNSHRENWFKSLRKDKLIPVAHLIEVVPKGEDWGAAEIFWIAYYKSLGARLVNSTEGGEGCRFTGKALEHQRKIVSERNRSPEQRAAVSAKLKGREITQEQREQISKTLTGTKASDATKKKLSEAQLRIWAASPDLKAGRVAALHACPRKGWTEEAKEVQRQKMLGKEPPNKGKPMSDEQKQLLSVARKGKAGHPHTEEHKAHMSEVMKGRAFSEETKAKMSASAKKRWGK